MVLPLIRKWEDLRGKGSFKLEEAEIDVLNAFPGYDKNGMQIDTKIDFIANKSKMNVHVYNTTQKLTFMGKNYRSFVDDRLEPYFLKNIENCEKYISEYNRKVIEAFQVPMKKPVKMQTFKTKPKPGYRCKNCSISYNNSSLLEKHKQNSHKVIEIDSDDSDLEIEYQRLSSSTRNSFTVQEHPVVAILNEVISELYLMDDTESEDNGNLNENKKLDIKSPKQKATKSDPKVQFTCVECKRPMLVKEDM